MTVIDAGARHLDSHDEAATRIADMVFDVRHLVWYLMVTGLPGEPPPTRTAAPLGVGAEKVGRSTFAVSIHVRAVRPWNERVER